MLSASGTEIVNTSGEAVYLKGVNLGNWLLQEGWMISGDGNTPGTQSEMKKILYDRGFSVAEIESFYQDWRDNFITQADIEFIASKGMNCIRVPMHYELFLPSTLRAARAEVAYGTRTYNSYKELLAGSLSSIGTDYTTPGYEKIDNLISWCSANGIYVILDMHAVPGSQGTDEHIADAIGTVNDLWISSVNQDVLNQIWDQISNRYKNNAAIAMYNLINEPNGIPSAATMQSVYQRLVTTIRGNNDNHLIMLEGDGWGNNYNGNTPDLFSPRTNLVYSIHRYDFDAWACPTDVNAFDPFGNPNQIQYLGSANAFRNTYNVPIFCGETGLRNYTWMSENTASLEQLGIGWTIWSYKWHTPMSFEYGFGNIPGIYPVEIYNTTDMATVLENIKYSNMDVNTNTGFWDALATSGSTTPPGGTVTYTEIPGTIEAEDYASMSGIETETCSEGGENVGWIEAGDWMMYDIDVQSSGTYTVSYRIASMSGGGEIQLEQAGGGSVYGSIAVPNTGGWQAWETISSTVNLTAGEQTIAIAANEGGFNINWLSFASSDGTTTTPVTGVSISSTSVSITDGSTTQLSATVSPASASNKNVSWSSNNTSVATVNSSGLVTAQSNGSATITVTTSDGGYTATSAVSVTSSTIPGESFSQLIEAEDYSMMYGVQTETTTDIGGGQNVGWIDAGDWMIWDVDLPSTGTYTIEYRVASPDGGGSIQLEAAGGGTVYGTIDVPATGGWQDWTTISHQVELNGGNQQIAIYVPSAGYNINWLQITESSLKSSAQNTESVMTKISSLSVYPNPASSELNIKADNSQVIEKIDIYTMTGQLIMKHESNTNFASINISDLTKGTYIIMIQAGNKVETKKFIKE